MNPGIDHPALEGPATALASRDAAPRGLRAAPLGQGAIEALPSGRPPLRPMDFLVTAALRPWLLLLAFLLPAAAGFAAFFLAPQRYPAETLLLVRAGREATGVTDTAGVAPAVTAVDMAKVVRSELDMLRSVDVLRDVVRTVGIGALYPWINEPRLLGLLPPIEPERREDRAIDALRGALHAEVGENSNTLRVVYSNERPAIAISTVMALLSAYRERRDRLLAGGNASLLGEEAMRAGEALRALDGELRGQLARLGVSDAGQEAQLVGQRLDTLRRRAGEVVEAQAGTAAQLRAARELIQSLPPTILASRETSNQTANDESANELLRLQIQHTHLVAQYAANHPLVQEVNRKIATARAAVAESRRPRFATTREVRNPAVEWLNGRAAALDLDGQAQARQLAEMHTQITQLETRLGVLRDADVRLRDLARQREVLEASYRQYTAREAASRIEEDAQRNRNPTIQVVQQAAIPYSPRGLGPSLAVFGIAAGLFAAAAALVIATLLRGTAATAEEAQRGTGLPLLACLPVVPADADPMQPADPGVRDLVAMLLDSALLGDRLNVIQLVAPPGGGAAHVALGLAMSVAFARDRDQRTLLIDLSSDGRAHLARLGGQPLKADDAGDGLLAFNTVIPHLWIAYDATGSDIADARRGLHQTLATLDRLRQVLDVVVVVAPEGDMQGYGLRRLAALVDTNLLMLRAEGTGLEAARGLRDRLGSAGGRLPGFVLMGERLVLPAFLRRRLASLA